jgi:hypothetical protein
MENEAREIDARIWRKGMDYAEKRRCSRAARFVLTRSWSPPRYENRRGENSSAIRRYAPENR